MNLTDLSSLVSVLVALSVAAERLVEIVKGFVPFLNQENGDPRMEGIRKSLLQILAVASGIVTVFLTRPVIGNVESMDQGPWSPNSPIVGRVYSPSDCLPAAGRASGTRSSRMSTRPRM